ncbi:deoxynucleoside kinase [Reichenbachiella agarivorans]|uniref:Deoxynucleoside kinase n=1 Tax=Reichenbachiella agarivorans TaxID=2979464 RepID=A0ABY6CL59_9BACT|nr:deoxynucleoside kinase [Reichenbachiella agarivorans]UXP31254.1 deoxynucleoside kinase [Reichenbachiella agarivorans]
MIKHIAIAGNIGAGKTTLTKMLAKHYGWEVELEEVDNNPYLEDFYKDMARWSFHLQIYFLNSRFGQVHQIAKKDRPVIQDRTIYEDAYIFAKSLYDQGYFSPRDYENYLALFKSMIKYVKPPDLLIYLRCDIDHLVRNIEKRGREYEKTIRIDYLRELKEHYETWIQNYDEGKLLIIDVNKLNFVDKQEDFAQIVSNLDRELFGLFS